jgi:HK97 family phage portal protein
MGLLDVFFTRERTEQDVLREAAEILTRDGVEPLEGTNMSLFNSLIPNWWTQEGMNDAGKMFWPGDGRLADRVWITNRCLQMNSQQIASMPLRFAAPNVADSTEPAWVSNPDPVYYPNGIGSMMKALIRDWYGWGYALTYITSRYANGYPRTFTRVPASRCEPMFDANGFREYKVGDVYLPPEDVVQIDRDPGCDSWLAHGTSAIRSYAQMMWGLLAAGNTAMDVNQGGVPKAVLKVSDENRKIGPTQAENLQTQWMIRTQARNGAPPVLPPGLDFETLSWNPKDMALLETQEFNALALAAAFGIPAVLLNMAIRFGMTYQNPGMLGEMWWRFELRPTAKDFADAWTTQMLPSGQWVWFDAKDTFLALDTSSEQDDPEAENVQQDTSTDPQAETPTSAPASPAQATNGRATGLTAIGGRR